MKRLVLFLGVIFLMAASYIAGNVLTARSPGTGGNGRKILHYVDPMHPSYTSDKPGIAPDCGMALEPVYADGTVGDKDATPLPPGAVRISAERQQLIGVAVATAEQAGGSQILRFPGRVVPDERKTYVINSTIDGWITAIRPSTTGSLVSKDEVLATFYSPEFLSASQALLFALNSIDRAQANPNVANQVQKDQLTQFNINLKQYRDSLRNLGMGDPQINEMIRTRKFQENVDIISPANGFIISRNVSFGQRFEKGKELYRLADLSRVWVLMDTYGTEAESLKPGMMLKVLSANSTRSSMARVSNVLPQFDPASRTLKVRLEVDNPGFHLRPDMFVDVEVPLRMPAMLSVPTEAVLDSGLRKTIFIEAAPGTFVPREVQTGRTVGNRVEIVSGVKKGERVAVSGTFLIDSESRMKTAASGITGTPQQDPVCGMYVDEAKSRARGLVVEAGGATNFFCSEECRKKFKPAVAKTAAVKEPAVKPARQAAGHDGHEEHERQGGKPTSGHMEHGSGHAPGAPAPAKPESHEKGHMHD